MDTVTPRSASAEAEMFSISESERFMPARLHSRSCAPFNLQRAIDHYFGLMPKSILSLKSQPDHSQRSSFESEKDA